MFNAVLDDFVRLSADARKGINEVRIDHKKIDPLSSLDNIRTEFHLQQTDQLLF
jgi:hypothetical protein